MPIDEFLDNAKKFRTSRELRVRNEALKGMLNLRDFLERPERAYLVSMIHGPYRNIAPSLELDNFLELVRTQRANVTPDVLEELERFNLQGAEIPYLQALKNYV